MALSHHIINYRSASAFDRAFLAALLISAMLHAGVLYTFHRWGDCICSVGQVVCPKIGQDCRPDVNLKLVEPEKEPPKPPKPKPKPPPKPAVIVEKPKPEKPPAAPKAGKVVLPEEALTPAPPPQAEITLDRPGLPEEVVVKESEAKAPVIATGEIFGRVDSLSPGEPGVFGLGGTGTAVGVGPFGTEEDGGGVATAESQTPAPTPEPPKPKGPTRPPRVLNWTDPPYPEQARQQGIEGTVTLKLRVSAEGRAQDVTVVRSSGHTALDQAAVAHVQRARFSAALEDGRAVPMTITFRVKFRLVNT